MVTSHYTVKPLAIHCLLYIGSTETKYFYTIAIGGNISLHCEASGYPLPIVYWKYGDEILLSGLGRVSLSFVNASASATGVYTCIANSMYHDEISRSTFLSVNPPHVHMRPTTPFHGMFLRA